jgi:PPK2 family polyphosphate:nucleotide phosphotransferase
MSEPAETGPPAADYRRRFIVEPGTRFSLADVDAGFRDRPLNKQSAQALIERNRARMEALQMWLYADRKQALLILLQGIDAAGKDGIVTHIISAMNPLGVAVTGFKVPTPVEAAHDFLWRHHLAVPQRGWVGIFNRTWYEAVLVERVHALVPQKVWSRRFDEINDFEEMLAANGTTLIKLFLYISRDEQLNRFKARLDDPLKQWKISESDYTERDLWPKYIEAYDDVFTRCSTKVAPWYVIPANHKWFRNLAASQIIVAVMDGMNITAPKPSVDIEAIRRKYHAEAKK